MYKEEMNIEGKKLTDTTMVGVLQLMEEDVCPPLYVVPSMASKGRLGPRQGPDGRGNGTIAPHGDAASTQLAASPCESPVARLVTLRRRGAVYLLGPLGELPRSIGSC
jgi:hypothetical protein